MVPDCPRCGLHFEREHGLLGRRARDQHHGGRRAVRGRVRRAARRDDPRRPGGRRCSSCSSRSRCFGPIVFYPFSKTVWVAVDRAFLQRLDPQRTHRLNALTAGRLRSGRRLEQLHHRGRGSRPGSRAGRSRCAGRRAATRSAVGAGSPASCSSAGRTRRRRSARRAARDCSMVILSSSMIARPRIRPVRSAWVRKSTGRHAQPVRSTRSVRMPSSNVQVASPTIA